MISPEPAPGSVPALDPLAGPPPDSRVRVAREPGTGSTGSAGVEPITCTRHFAVRRREGAVEVVHDLAPGALDNDLAGWLADELFDPGWLSGNETFERVFTGIVTTTGDDPREAWSRFYANTLERLRHAVAGGSGEPASDGDDAAAGGGAGPARSGAGPAGPLIEGQRTSVIDDIAPVYARALSLAGEGSVLDLGSCFGFFPLLLAERSRSSVLASDIVPGSMRLLATVAEQRGLRLETLVCDAAHVPVADRSVSTVTVLHLLEHLEPEQGTAVLREALRLAAERVVVAVPFEDIPAEAYGHRHCFTLERLDELGASTGVPYAVGEYHGGWLVLDTVGGPT